MGLSRRKSNSPTVPQWSQRRWVVPSGRPSSAFAPAVSSVYLTSRYPTISLQLLHLAAQNILSAIANLVVQVDKRFLPKDCSMVQSKSLSSLEPVSREAGLNWAE